MQTDLPAALDLEEDSGEHDEINQDVLTVGLPGSSGYKNLLDDIIYMDDLPAHKDESSLLIVFFEWERIAQR